MEVVVCHDFGESEIQDVPRPTPGADEALLEVRRVQLSVTECNLYRGWDIAHADVIRRRLADPPVRLFGHEFCATVVEVGDGVTPLAPGD